MSFWNQERHQYSKQALGLTFLGLFILLFSPFAIPIALAAVMALAVNSLLEKIARKEIFVKGKNMPLIFFVIFILFTTPLLFLLYKLILQVNTFAGSDVTNSDLYQKFDVLKDAALRFLTSTSEKFNLKINFYALFNSFTKQIGDYTLNFTKSILTSIPQAALKLFAFFAALYFFLTQTYVIKKFFIGLNLLSERDAEIVVQDLRLSSYNALVISIVVGAIQATIVAIGAMVFHTGSFIDIFLITFMLSFIPVIGAAPVALILSAYNFVLGNYTPAIGLIFVGAIVGSIDNIIRSFMMSSSEKDIHPIVSLLGLIGAIIIFGIPGIFFGPVILSLCFKLIPFAWADRRSDS